MNVDIAERLAKRRREAGYSQEHLAEKLGVSRQAVSKWERSESSPDTDNLIALAQLYGVSLDSLLYVDEDIKEDFEFEVADRAAERKAHETQVGAAPASESFPSQASVSTPPADSPYESQDSSTAEPSESQTTQSHAVKNKVKISPSGIHVLDGDDYVHVSWRDGIHVKDSKRGDQVHVGWDGINVKERTPTPPGHIPPEDVIVEDEHGNQVNWEHGKVVINGKEYASWCDAHEECEQDNWGGPTAYTVMGERFDTLEEARQKYGPEVGATIPVRKHYMPHAWMRFPFPLVVVLAYLMVGAFVGAWGVGLFLFFLIPLYYLAGHALSNRKISTFLMGGYPVVVTAWFLYMAFVLNDPHPAWVIVFTIPLVEWFLATISKAYRRRKHAA